MRKYIHTLTCIYLYIYTCILFLFWNTIKIYIWKYVLEKCVSSINLTIHCITSTTISQIVLHNLSFQRNYNFLLEDLFILRVLFLFKFYISKIQEKLIQKLKCSIKLKQKPWETSEMNNIITSLSLK